MGEIKQQEVLAELAGQETSDKETENVKELDILKEKEEETQESQQPYDVAEADRWDALIREYPDVTAENIPDEVLASICEGALPVDAMRAYENRELKKELESLRLRLTQEETGRDNRLKSTGTARTSGEPATDPFLEGLAQ